MKKVRSSGTRYPVPSDSGGTLIRRVIATFKDQAQELPLQGTIAISVSGGVDSMVLAHLLCRYGRKIIPEPAKQVTLLHFDHQWRVESGTREKLAVAQLAQVLGVKFESIKLDSPTQSRLSKNLEEDARRKRKAEYDRMQKESTGHAVILTAHHEDDVVETLVWRFFRGELKTHHQGILFQHDGCLRPLIKVTKAEILAYAQAESVAYCNDPSNQDTHQIRAYFREVLFPQLETRFPGFKAVIMRYTKEP